MRGARQGATGEDYREESKKQAARLTAANALQAGPSKRTIPNNLVLEPSSQQQSFDLPTGCSYTSLVVDSEVNERFERAALRSLSRPAPTPLLPTGPPHMRPVNFSRLDTRIFRHQDSRQVGVECSICMVRFETGARLKVLWCAGRHAFHASCIRTWLLHHRTCPLCREDLGQAPPNERYPGKKPREKEEDSSGGSERFVSKASQEMEKLMRKHGG